MKHWKPILLTSAIFALLLVLSACGSTQEGDISDVPGEVVAEETTPAEQAKAVEEQIAAIQVGNLDTEAAVDAAWLAYCALEDEAKALVSSDRILSLRQEVASCYARTDRKGTFMERSKVLIGSYPLNDTSEEHIQEVKAAGMDFMSGGLTYTQEDLDLMQKYDLGMITHGPHVSHTAMWGKFLTDEPSAAAFESLEQLRIEYEEANPDCLGIVTLLPNYATDTQLGTNGYQAHIDAFVETFQSDIIMYDFYMFQGTGSNLAGMMENLRIVANACQENDRDLWMWLQANHPRENKSLTEDQIRVQANIAMAYGTTGIMWACWENGWWYSNMHDTEGNKTDIYDYVQKVNAEINQLSPVFIKYKALGTKLIGEIGDTGALAEVSRMEGNNIEQSVLTDIKTAGEDDLILSGWFEKKLGTGNAMMFVNLTNKLCRLKPVATVTFKAPEGAVITLHTKEGSRVLTPSDEGIYTIEVPNAEYAFVTVD